MRTQVLAASTMAISLAGCAQQPADVWGVETSPIDEPWDSNPPPTHTLSFTTYGDPVFTNDVMSVVADACSSDKVLSPEDVNMTFESVVVPLVTDGPDMAIYLHSFRCPEPGKEIA